jgi:4-hydroxy-tetrahydrodipicolinate synthase
MLNKNQKNFKFKGVFVPMVTIFKENEEINYEKIKEHVEFLIEAGVSGIITNAATSEFFSLSLSERKKIDELVVKQVDGRIKVWNGTAACATKDVVELSKHSEYIGSDGVMVVPHYYIPLGEKETFRHFEMICKEIKIPVIIYNCPQVSYVNIGPELLLRIINNVSNNIYVKDSSNSLNNIQDLIYKTENNVGIFCGEEPICLEALYIGCVGIIPLLANAFPEIFIKIYNLVEKNNFIEAKNLHYKCLSLFNYTCFNEYCSISIVKAISNILKRDIGKPRMPIIPLPEIEINKLKGLLKKWEII